MADKRISELVATNIVDPGDRFILQRGATNLNILGSDLIAALEGNTIGGQATSTLLQNPTGLEDGYAIVWDNTAGEYTLAAAAGGGGEDLSTTLGIGNSTGGTNIELTVGDRIVGRNASVNDMYLEFASPVNDRITLVATSAGSNLNLGSDSLVQVQSFSGGVKIEAAGGDGVVFQTANNIMKFIGLVEDTGDTYDKVLVLEPGAGTQVKWRPSSDFGGSTTFLGLTDTPASYTGQTLKGIRVNVGETALEFVDLADPTQIAGQNTDALVQSPTATEDGYVIAWNNTNNEYELIAGGGGDSGNILDTDGLTLTTNKIHTITSGQSVKFQNSEASPGEIIRFQGSATFNGVFLDSAKLSIGGASIGAASPMIQVSNTATNAEPLIELIGNGGGKFAINDKGNSSWILDNTATQINIGRVDVGPIGDTIVAFTSDKATDYIYVRSSTQYFATWGITGTGLYFDYRKGNQIWMVGNNENVLLKDAVAGSSTPLAKLHVKSSISTPLRVDSGGVDNALLVDSAGKVGVNETPGSFQLNVKQDAGASNDSFIARFGHDATSDMQIRNTDALGTYLRFAETGSEQGLLSMISNSYFKHPDFRLGIGTTNDGAIDFALNVERNAPSGTSYVARFGHDNLSDIQVRNTDALGTHFRFGESGSVQGILTNIGDSYFINSGFRLGLGIQVPFARLHVQASLGQNPLIVDTSTLFNVIRVESGGNIRMEHLPTSAPATAGTLWNDGGTVKIV